MAVLVSHPGCFGLKLALRGCETLIVDKWVHGELVSSLFRHFRLLLEERASRYLLLEGELP